MRSWPFSCVLALLWAFLTACSGAITVRRHGNLDYLDAATLEYYLSHPKADYDVVVMYYAQWCQNCHALAPIWEQIARILHAGTVDSKLIVGLFDCEADYEHSQLCNRAGVKHYPTLQFFSLSGQSLQRKKPKHTSIYAGNWQYGDSILDWIKTMSFLSQWHRAGWGKRLRHMLMNRGNKKQVETLPVGVPGQSGGGSTTATAGAGSTTTGGTSASTAAAAAAQIVQLQEESKQLRDLAVRSSLFVETLMFPVQDKTVPNATVTQNGKNYTDVFSLLHQTGSWANNDSSTVSEQRMIIKLCAMEVSLDYCNRLSTRIMSDWLGDQSAHLQIKDMTEAELTRYFQTELKDQVATVEPFCAIIEECVIAEFEPAFCRPETCPFVADPVACRYLTACLTESLQQEYADALGLTTDKDKNTSLKENASQATEPQKSKKGSCAWGI